MTKDEEMLQKTLLDQGKLRGRPFTRALSDRTRQNDFSLKENMFREKKISIMRVMMHWNRLPREAVDSPSMEIFTTRLDGTLSMNMNMI